MVRASEGDDSRAAGHEQRRPQGDLDRVLPGDAEHDLTPFAGESRAQLRSHVRLGEVAERVHAAIRLGTNGRLDLGAPMTECGHPEASREVDVAAPVGVDDAAALCLRPDHGRSLLSVSIAT